MMELTPEALVESYRRAKDRRTTWETHWRECYEYALPLRSDATGNGAKTGDKLFDGTAPDAVDQLAASMLSSLTPPWSRWVGLAAGPDLDESERVELAPKLTKVSEILQSHFNRSNFTTEIHQCYLDLVTVGTACLMMEESPLGEASAFRFTAVPVFDVVFESDSNGRLEGTMRRVELTQRELKQRYPNAPDYAKSSNPFVNTAKDIRIGVIEAVFPDDKGYRYMAVVEPSPGLSNDSEIVGQGHFEKSPFINFRWQKAPGEIYGRSPVMKALPDIKTSNKVVELVLKNASIAVTGIWQADDDGVLNPANVKLVPGAIIPKAVGSSGLTPLNAPGQFDVSGLVLDSLRARIRSALLADKLAQVNAPGMTATEVLERSTEMARILGATYGRLQSELLNPLIDRAVSILRRRGEIPSITLDGRTVDVDYRSPMAKRQMQDDIAAALKWHQMMSALGGEASQIVDVHKAALWLAKSFGVPEDLIRTDVYSTPSTDMKPTDGEAFEKIISSVDQRAPSERPIPSASETKPALKDGSIVPSDVKHDVGFVPSPFSRGAK